MNDCEQTIRPALEQALDDFHIESHGGRCVVTTPFQHPNGDLVTLHIEEWQGHLYRIRDYGETYSMLQLYGVDAESATREDEIEHIEHQFGLETTDGELRMQATKDTLGSRFFDTVQAVLAVSHLIYKHRSQVPSQFQTQVKSFLEESGYEYSQNFEVTKGNQQREFDFSINHRRDRILLDTIHTGDKYQLGQKADTVLVNWYVIQDRPYQHGVIIDDVDGVYEQSKIDALIENLDYFFRWSDRDTITNEIPITV